MKLGYEMGIKELKYQNDSQMIIEQVND